MLASDADVETPEFARRLRNAVACLYLAAARLPRGGPGTTEDIPAPSADRQPSQALEQRIRLRFGALAQELVELDQDLADSLARLEEPQSPDALWQAWSAFEEHWGKHAVDVLRPLHRIARGGVG